MRILLIFQPENMSVHENSKPNFQIVGLSSSDNGRSCGQHSCCGQHVSEGDLLRLVRCVVTINGVPEQAVKLVKVTDGADSCTVAYIPREELRNPKIEASINNFCQVLELYHNSDSGYKRKLSHKNLGMATAVFLNEIPVDE
jgi:hypothetical protein